ncbi:ATP-binding protein [Leuconostoc suionicum]|uniref:ATP-binding protein n=2 Tax=Leuconostoc suionicum TaxID=1511761 RepID=UPI00300C5E20
MMDKQKRKDTSLIFKRQFFDVKAQEYLPISADELLSQHLLITGVTGSGKSSTALTIIEELKKNQQNVIVLDPTGEFRTIPNVQRIVLGNDGFFDVTHLTSDQIGHLLNITDESLLGKLPAAIESLQIQNNVVAKPGIYKKINRSQIEHDNLVEQLKIKDKYFDLSLLANQLQEEFITPYVDERADFSLLGQIYDKKAIAKAWSSLAQLKQTLKNKQIRTLLSRSMKQGIVHYDVDYLLRLFITRQATKQSLIIDLSLFSHEQKLNQVLVEILTMQMMSIAKLTGPSFPVTIFIDEAHRYLSNNGHGNHGIFSLIREGRKLGLDLMMSTQSPLDVPVELLGQFGSFIVQRLNTRNEMKNLLIIKGDLIDQVANLATGEALLKTVGRQELKKVKVELSTISHQTENIQFGL